MKFDRNWVGLRSPNAEEKIGGVSEADRPRTVQSFCVLKHEIATNGYDLSLNRYKEVVHQVVDHVPPQEILETLAELETKIQQGMTELKEMLN